MAEDKPGFATGSASASKRYGEVYQAAAIAAIESCYAKANAILAGTDADKQRLAAEAVSDKAILKAKQDARDAVNAAIAVREHGSGDMVKDIIARAMQTVDE